MASCICVTSLKLAPSDSLIDTDRFLFVMSRAQHYTLVSSIGSIES